MKALPKHEFTRDHNVAKDGTVTFRCSDDIGIWPWLALDTQHPIVVQTINYWASVEAARARGTLDLSQWTALTHSDWQCGEKEAGPLSHGKAEVENEGDREAYRLTFYDRDNAMIVQIRGKGVVFRNRDFESWRESAKQHLAKRAKQASFKYAAAASVGVASQKESLISPLCAGNEPSAQALITKENGLMPAHPYHSGSGDHVNANHLADVATQFASLQRGAPVNVRGGEMHFLHYVELGHPFEISMESYQRAQHAISMAVTQAERNCAQINLKFAAD